MAQIIAHLTLDTYEKNKIPPLIVPQGDYGSREIVATITTQGKRKSVDSTAAVFIVARRTADNVSKAFGGNANADGTVTVPITQWMLAYPDDVVCHVSVTGDGYQYSTNEFLIEAQEKDTPNDISEDDPDVDFVAEVLANENARQAAEATRVSNENERKTAEDARRSAETQRVTDESTRITNEAQRVSAEASRDATFKSWANDIALLPDMSARISRNSKRLDGLEQRINPSPFVTDSTVAYQKDVPENAVGAVEIQKIGGMTYKDGNTLKSAKVTEVKSVGVNIWDEEWESGYINLDTGNKGTDATCSRSVNFISVEPSTTYYLYNGSWDQSRVAFYGSSKNYIGYITTAQFTTPANCRYIRFYWVGTEYNNDICINKSNVSINGKYYPYVKHTLPIPEAVRHANGINDTVYDYIEWDADGVTKKSHKKCGVVDLGTLNWNGSGDGRFSANITTLTEYLPGPNSTPIMICAKYQNISPSQWYDKITMGISQSTRGYGAPNSVLVCDINYTDAATFKAAMSGVMLVYELAAPEVIDISDLITSDNLLSIQGGGTLTFENEYGYAVPSTVEYITAEATA